MARHGKKYTKVAEKVDRETLYTLEGAIQFLKDNPTTKFDATAEVAFRLGVDPTKSDQAVRGTVVLPNGTGKKVTVLVFANGPAADAAREAGAEYVGFEDMLAKVKEGFTGFDVAIATPDAMKEVRKLGKVLGPRGLMPSAKAGTVTMNVAQAVTEIKAGRVEYRIDKFGILHNGIGKASFGKDKILGNVRAYFGAVLKSRPQAVKGVFVKSLTLSTTMGIGVKIDVADAEKFCSVTE